MPIPPCLATTQTHRSSTSISLYASFITTGEPALADTRIGIQRMQAIDALEHPEVGFHMHVKINITLDIQMLE